MDVVTLFFLYIGFIASYVFILLFGELDMFQGTPVSFAYWLMTEGICEGFVRSVYKLFGDRGDPITKIQMGHIVCAILVTVEWSYTVCNKTMFLKR